MTRRPARTRNGSGIGRGPTCPTCHDHTIAAIECGNCRRHRWTLAADLAPVTALVGHHRSHPIRNDLHNYKNAGHHDQHQARRRLAALIAPALDTYTRNGALLVPVPSTRNPHTNQLAELITETGHTRSLLLAATKHHQNRSAEPDLFTTTTSPPQNRRIVLVEDCYVTGATAQAAAHTLTKAGAANVTILTIGRRYR